MHDALRRALAPVLADARTTGAPVPEILDEPWGDVPGHETAMAPGHGLGVLLSDSETARIVAAADQVQEWVIEERWPSSTTNWPPCPQHPTTHPLQARALVDGAFWTCPATSAPVSRIGRLQPAARA